MESCRVDHIWNRERQTRWANREQIAPGWVGHRHPGKRYEATGL